MYRWTLKCFLVSYNKLLLVIAWYMHRTSCIYASTKEHMLTAYTPNKFANDPSFSFNKYHLSSSTKKRSSRVLLQLLLLVWPILSLDSHIGSKFIFSFLILILNVCLYKLIEAMIQQQLLFSTLSTLNCLSDTILQ